VWKRRQNGRKEGKDSRIERKNLIKQMKKPRRRVECSVFVLHVTFAVFNEVRFLSLISFNQLIVNILSCIVLIAPQILFH